MGIITLSYLPHRKVANNVCAGLWRWRVLRNVLSSQVASETSYRLDWERKRECTQKHPLDLPQKWLELGLDFCKGSLESRIHHYSFYQASSLGKPTPLARRARGQEYHSWTSQRGHLSKAKHSSSLEMSILPDIPALAAWECKGWRLSSNSALQCTTDRLKTQPIGLRVLQ